MIKQKNVDEIKPVLLEMINESGWVEGPANPGNVLFSTPLLNKTIPKKGKFEWLNDQIFVFSILQDMKGRLYLITKVIPGDENIRDIIFNALAGLDCLFKPGHKAEWINHTWLRTNFSEEDFIGKSKDEIKEMLKADWVKITGIVNKVESELLKYKKEFKPTQVNKAIQKAHWHRWGQPVPGSGAKVRQQPARMPPRRSAA